ncbi:helix-turn-helix domain-containing protein [Polaribacter sp. MSW13]|uniref:Helix-turn-helix domain-containing protein n=1 Tax=Polaribacter marinus TaxID=2916838 RepID=A0A9X1VPY3_9FLAO|nr:helix-turn-helix domain-containing protein [Polaribacter marinus]MCI2228982.1 helix-turn-helix domain-containing protein [Polaribacter marinus]
MQNSILLQNVSPERLTELIKDGVKSQLEDFKKEFHNLNSKEDLLNRQQVLELLNINATTLWHYQNKGKIPFYKLANKCYYKRSEIMNSLIPVKK